MSKQFNTKIGIFLASLTLIMSILALLLLNGSTAWFASNSGVSADGFGVKVKNEASTSAFLKSYAVTEINYETGAYTTAFEESMESHILPTEDPNGISYSEYKKALAVMLPVTALEASDWKEQPHGENEYVSTHVGLF